MARALLFSHDGSHFDHASRARAEGAFSVFLGIVETFLILRFLGEICLKPR
jgi:hypothetical protein